MTDLRQIVSRLEQGGGELELEGERIRYRIPKGDAEVWSLLNELRGHREALLGLLRARAAEQKVCPCTSSDPQLCFPQPHAKLFLFIGRKVRTPAGPGTLLQVWADRVTVLLDSELSKCSFFVPAAIQPANGEWWG